MSHSQIIRNCIQNASRSGLFNGVGAAGSRSVPCISVLQQQQASYHDKVIDHYENPRNVGSLDKTDDNVGTGLVGAPACGDVMKLQIKVDDDGKIVDAKFKTFGCGSAIASSSLATEWIKGKSIDAAGKIKNTDIAKELCLPPVKLHCSMLAEDAIKAALADYKVKKENGNGAAKSTKAV
jgi:Fe-S cluster assembly scaffold IscU